MSSIRVDALLGRDDPRVPGPDWVTRSLFQADRAAALWSTRSDAPTALEAPPDVLAAYREALLRVAGPPGAVISFGPADGRLDAALLRQLPRRPLLYVGLDINAELCDRAVRAACIHADTAYGLVCDLEAQHGLVLDFLTARLRPRGSTLFLCTGNMVGNLDRGERNFLRFVENCMARDDTLLMSVATGAFPQPIGRRSFDESVGWADLEELIAGGLSQRTGEAADAVLAKLDARLDVREGVSDVPGTSAIDVYDRVSALSVLFMRRYAPSSFECSVARWLGCDVLFSTEVVLPLPGLGLGVYLFRRR
jgi:hypothetical protein